MSETVPGVVKNHRDTATQLAIDNITPLAGEITFESDTDRFKIGDEVTNYNDLDYQDQAGALPENNDISGTNFIKALPAINGKGQTVKVFWFGGDGSNTQTFTVSDAATIGGVAANLWTGEGEGNINLSSDGTNWVVDAYEDSGSNANGTWKKSLNGELFQKKGKLVAVIASSVANHYGTTSGTSYFKADSHTFPIPFTTLELIKVDTDRIAGDSGAGIGTSYATIPTLTGMDTVVFGQNGSNVGYNYTAYGKWR